MDIHFKFLATIPQMIVECNEFVLYFNSLNRILKNDVVMVILKNMRRHQYCRSVTIRPEQCRLIVFIFHQLSHLIFLNPFLSSASIDTLLQYIILGFCLPLNPLQKGISHQESTILLCGYSTYKNPGDSCNHKIKIWQS